MIEKLHAKFPNVHQSVVVSGPGWFERSYDVPDILNFYKSYFNIGYHLFLVPFRYRLIKGNINDVEKSTVAGKTHCYNMHQNKAQKILTAIFTPVVFFGFITRLRRFPYYKLTRTVHPAAYFKVCIDLSDILLKLIFMQNMWFGSTKFLKISQFITNNRHMKIFQNKEKITSKCCTYVICLAPLIVGLISRIMYETGQSHSTPFISRYVAEGRFKFFLDKAASASVRSSRMQDSMNSLDYVVAILTLFFSIISSTSTYFAEGLLLMGCLTLWTAVIGFETFITNHGSQRPTSVLNEYQVLKNFCRLINDAISPLVFVYILNGIVYYSNYINGVFIVDNSTSDKLSTLYFVFNFIVILYLCGDLAARPSNVIKKWLEGQTRTDQNGGLGVKEFIMILYDSSHHTVAVNGMCFTLHWATIFGIVGTVVTYFVICGTSDLRGKEWPQ
ncbi:hypothetical protein Fcan01_01497 [Folsomia candida]|uniref:Gustatory receptor n=2 Tax=Folsomia candida TaxID=158441 RepID=A0A226EWR4_FOLCA|nr:hypothetical protein Fcan01_01497 [Folsomia candida]